MINNINKLKNLTNKKEVKSICEQAINAISSTIYNNVTEEAKSEIEKYTIENLFESLKSHSNETVVNEWLETNKRLYTISNLGVKNAINKLMVTEGKTNKALNAILENFKELSEGKHEVMLYEAFINAMQNYTYFPAVQTELSSIKDRVKNYKVDVDITKIIETMKETKSEYLVPLIEDVVNNYLTSKTEQNKSFLKEMLIKFSYDPFVRDIINLVSLDASNLKLEYTNESCEVSKVFSPVLYVNESEAIFNIKGIFYNKKSNNIYKLNESDISKLDKEFVAICGVVNMPNVEITDKNIKVFSNVHNAILTESKINIDGKDVDNETYKELVEHAMFRGDEQFYSIVESLRRNYNEIAEINFAKRVYLKENENYSADVFKLRDNIFIATFDDVNNKYSLYKNVNPIQAKQIMNEHLNYDISALFEGCISSEEKIISDVNETKEEYSNYIQVLENKIEEFSNNEDKLSKEVLGLLYEELSEVKNEYKEYLGLVENYTNPIASLDEAITVSIDVNGKKYMVPIPQETTNGGELSNDNNIAGTEVGSDLVNKPASSITFSDEESEVLSDEPSLETSKIDLDTEKVEKEAEEKEAEAEENKSDNEESEENKKEEATNSEEETEETEETDEEKKKKKEKNESSEGNKINEAKKKKLILRKKK